ncbi:MAG: histidine ammonia-lyase [Prolixibacteraceae bacterium]|nr:histidine ammonia-lyase [Prolixibacteraceae bacterium]
MTKQKYFNYGEDHLTTGLALRIASGEIAGRITAVAAEVIEKSRRRVDEIVADHQSVYGINTGFGPLCTTIISEKDTKTLQYNILKSHSVGVGDPILAEIAKLMMILKVHALSMGYSGIAMSTLERIIWHIDNDIIPVVPSQGSVGASGDLAPLSHLFLPLIGLGEVYFDGIRTETGKVLQQFGLEPVELGAKEGLALINGTQFIAAHAIKVVERLQNSLDNADLIAAMNLEAMLGSVKTFTEELHLLRPYRGTIYVAERMRMLLADSEMVQSHKNCTRVQDPYSIRCIPQVHGASRNAFLHLKELLHIELNSVTDNPILLRDGSTVSGGNFHGQPLAMALDYAAVAAAELGNIADRRIYLSLKDTIPGLPKLLMRETGLNSGFMIPQYTTAALVSENKSLCFPASADSIPTSLGQEDHVSMGSISARKCLMIIGNLEKIQGIELFCAAQGFDFRKPLKSSVIMEACHDLVREQIPFAGSDHVMSEEMNKAIAMVKSKSLVKCSGEVASGYGIKLKNEEDELFGIY